MQKYLWPIITIIILESTSLFSPSLLKDFCTIFHGDISVVSRLLSISRVAGTIGIVIMLIIILNIVLFLLVKTICPRVTFFDVVLIPFPDIVYLGIPAMAFCMIGGIFQYIVRGLTS